MPTLLSEHTTPDRSTRSTIWATVVRQLAAALLTMLAVSVVTFLATNIKSPQDVARSVLGRNAAPEQVIAFIATQELADPLPVRYGRWLGDFVRGDWGTSVVTDRPIQPELVPRIGRTLLLVGLSFLIVVPVSIAFGGYLAARWGTRRDVTATSGLMVLRAFPEFVVGLGAILVFSVLLRLLPPESGTAIAFGTLAAKAQAYLLPALTLVAVAAPFLVRLARASARESLTSASTRAATLRGLPRRTVIWDYGMRGNELEKVDQVTARAMEHVTNRRVIRALEIYYLTGIPLSELQSKKIEINFEPVLIGLDWERKELYDRINRRADAMIDAGLIQEIERLKEKGYNYKEYNSLNTVGVKEVFDYLEGRTDYNQMIELIKQNTRRFAKRQMSWFRRDKNIKWINANSEAAINQIVK